MKIYIADQIIEIPIAEGAGIDIVKKIDSSILFACK